MHIIFSKLSVKGATDEYHIKANKNKAEKNKYSIISFICSSRVGKSEKLMYKC
jgi:hypothetical protein